MKKYLCLALLLLLSLPNYAQRLFIGGGGGQTRFEETFGNGYNAHGKAVLISDVGVAFDFSSRYIVANRKADTDTGTALKMIPIMVGLSHVITPKSKIKPYMGGSIGGAILSESFDTPAFIYGWKIGVFVQVARDLMLYTEAETFYLEDAKQEVEIRPWLVTAGLLIKLGGRDVDVVEKKKDMTKQKRRRMYDRRQIDRKRYKNDRFGR
jgi:hypothetical protein